MNDQQPQTLNVAGSIVALLIVGLLWYITIALVTVKVPPENASNLGQVIGMVSMQVGIIIGWFFGGSYSSKKKDETIAAQASTIATTVPPVTPTADKTINLEPGQTGAVHANEPKP